MDTFDDDLRMARGPSSGTVRRCTVLSIVLAIVVLVLAIVLAVVWEKRLPCSDSSPLTTTFPSSWLRAAVMSDVHLDILYENTASALVDRGFPCHNTSNAAPFSAPYGRVQCDSPTSLLQSALDGIGEVDKTDTADVILVTGDKTAHFLYTAANGTNLNGTLVLAAQKTFAKTLASKFPTKRVMFTMGNNDVPQHWQIPDQDWYAKLWLEWSPLILCKACPNDRFGTLENINEADFNRTFLSGAYYKVQVTPKLTFVLLNTLYWTSYAWSQTPWRASTAIIAGHQMVWLESILATASMSGGKVLIVGHVPPGLDPFRVEEPNKKLIVRQFWFDNYTQEYLKILDKYRTSVGGQIFAHLHKDDMHVFAYQSGKALPTLLVPSISPIYENNPAFRWVYFSDTSDVWELADYTQYWLDMVQANAKRSGSAWKKQYTFSEAYPSESRTITGDRLLSIWKAIISNETVWETYKFHRQVRFANTFLSYSRYHLYCVAHSPDLQSYSKCRTTYPWDPSS